MHLAMLMLMLRVRVGSYPLGGGTDDSIDGSIDTRPKHPIYKYQGQGQGRVHLCRYSMLHIINLGLQAEPRNCLCPG